MPQYRRFIEDKFLIDDPNTGQLVPFKFRKVQAKYYDELVRDYDIENKGLSVPIRENIAKSRRHGFSSLILALFAADDLLSDNPTEGAVISYKDDATKVFRKRYRTFILSFIAQDLGIPREEIFRNIQILEEIAKEAFSTDSDGDYVLRKNGAHFVCGTASARVGGRGGVLQKLHFSEIAFYPDTAAISAAGMIEATMRQVDPASGWIFAESTDGGPATYQAKLWKAVKEGLSRFKNRFYGWRELYTEEEYALIKSESVDADEHRRDYPETEDDLFKGTANSFVGATALEALVEAKKPDKELVYWLEMQGVNYIEQAEIMAHTLERLVMDNPRKGLYVGIDTAKVKDATIMTVERATGIVTPGGVKAIAIDTTGGDWLADWFENNTSWYVIRCSFSRPFKDTIYTALQTVIAAGLTRLPVLKEGTEFVSDESRHFFTQMLGLVKQKIGYLLVVSHPKGNCADTGHDYDTCPYHDDYADSWALAEHAYMTINGVPERTEKPEAREIPTVESAVQDLLERKGKKSGRFGSAEEYM